MEDKDFIINELEKIEYLLSDAIDIGAQNVQTYFTDVDGNLLLNPDPFLSPNIMRFKALQFLKEHLWKIDGLSLINLQNNGIYLKYKNYYIRVWKSNGDELPDPGNSHTKQAFLRQHHPKYFQPQVFSTSDEGRPALNLVVSWKVSKRYKLIDLQLSCPKYRPLEEDIEVEWSVPLEHPVTTKERKDLDAFTPEDLPLERESKEVAALTPDLHVVHENELKHEEDLLNFEEGDSGE